MNKYKVSMTQTHQNQKISLLTFINKQKLKSLIRKQSIIKQITMNRLLELQQHLIAQNQQVTFAKLRASSTVDPLEAVKFAYGPNYEWRLKTLDIIKNNPKVFEHYHLTEADRPYTRLHSAKKLFDAKRLVNLQYDEYLQDPNKLSLVCSAYVNYNAAFSIKNGVHWFLYMKTLFNLGTQKHAQYVKRAVEYKDIGCFGLTQLQHGSNVRGVQTQAHYDHETRSFIMISPTKSAMKFWIGAAGNIANMSVIWAQLFVKGKCYGVHSFIVPLRDKITHKLLPGVLVGDCGPKNGCNEIDNGFILLDNVRIPVDNLLDRISQIDENGNFKCVVDSEDKRFGLQLGSLSGGRYMIAMNGSIIALQALTISLRYSAIRRQFAKSPKSPQSLLIEYPLMKRRLIPLLAQAIVYLTGNMQAIYTWDQNYKNILDPTNKVIQELHAISSATKPKTGWFTTECIKESRQALGGHGFSSYSKLGTLYNDHDVNNTWQGDNTVLLQQCTKFIFDNAKKAMKQQKIESPLLQFLENPPQQSDIKINKDIILCPIAFRKFLQFKIHRKLQQMAMKMMQLSKEKMGQFEIWNEVQAYLGKQIALTFADLFYLNTFFTRLRTLKHEPTANILSNCMTLWMLKVYRQDETVDSEHHGMIEDRIMEYCEKLTPQVLGLVEAVSAGDQVIGSPFADEKGNGMEKYMNHFMSVKGNREKPDWWRIIVDRQR